VAAISQNNHYLIHWCNKVHYLNGGIKLPLEVIVAAMIQNQRPLNWKIACFSSIRATLLIPRYLKQRGHTALRFAVLVHFTRKLHSQMNEVEGHLKLLFIHSFRHIKHMGRIQRLLGLTEDNMFHWSYSQISEYVCIF